jgi:hypothetical protein
VELTPSIPIRPTLNHRQWHAARQIPTSYPFGEDWGWFIEYLEGDQDRDSLRVVGHFVLQLNEAGDV